MKRLLVLSIAASFAIFTGCDSKGTTATVKATTPGAKTGDGKMTDGKMADGKMDSAFKAEKDTVTIAPGSELKVKMMGMPSGATPTFTYEPTTTDLNASVAGDELVIKAGDKATGSYTVTVTEGGKEAKVTVNIEKN